MNQHRKISIAVIQLSFHSNNIEELYNLQRQNYHIKQTINKILQTFMLPY